MIPCNYEVCGSDVIASRSVRGPAHYISNKDIKKTL